MLQVLRKALPFFLSPEKSGGVAGLSLWEPSGMGNGGEGVGGWGEDILGAEGVVELRERELRCVSMLRRASESATSD